MTQKTSNETISQSDKLAHRFTSEKSEFGDAEYASSVDNYDLIIDELDYVNTQIANIHGNTPLKRATAEKKPSNRKSAKNSARTEWISAKALMAYFPDLLQSEITTKLCEHQPAMRDKIKKHGRLMSLHISALSEFAQRTGLKIVTRKGATKQKTTKFRTGAASLKKQHKKTIDEDNMVYVINPKTK